MPPLGNKGVVRPSEIDYDPAPAPAPARVPQYVAAPTRATHYEPPHGTFHGGVPQAPFHQALRQAQRHVELAQRALPKQTTPAIPYVAKPTAAQTRAALTLATNHARSIGPKAFAELANDPRQHAYLNTVEHYLNAERGQQAAYESSVVGQGRQLTSPLGLVAARQQALQQEGERRQREGVGGPLDLGFINLAPAITKLATLKVPGLGGIPGKLVNEAIDMPAQTFLSGAIAGRATRQAVEGDTAPGKAILGSILQQLEHPVQSFEQAPLSTGLLLAGGENALGRLAGGAGRALTKDALRGADLAAVTGRAPTSAERLASALDTRRQPLNLYAGEKIVGRKYNPDPLRAAAQKGYEKALPNLPGQLAQADPFQATGWRLRRNLVGGVTKVGRTDRIAAAGEDTRRALVKGTTAKIEAAKPAFGANVAVPLIVQRAVRSPETALLDLQKVRKLWASAQASGELKGSALGANKANLGHLDELLAHPSMQTPEGAGQALAPAFAAAERHAELGHPFTAEQVHGGKLQPEQLRASLFPYAQTHMGAVYQDGGMRGPNGEHLPNEAILQHMAESGVAPPGYISHKTGIGGRGSFFKSTLKQPTLERYARTGAAFTNGTADHSWEATVGSLAKQATEAAQLQVRRRVLNRLSAGGPYDTQAAAAAAADNFHATAEGQQVANSVGKMVPVHMGSGQIVERGNIAPAASVPDTLRQFRLLEHTPVAAEASGKYALMPERVAKRLQAHDSALSTNSELGRGLQVYQQAFRRAKLNTSMPHIAGVVQEQAIRLGAELAGPRARQAGAKFSRQLSHLAELDTHGAIADSHGPLGDRYRELAASFANRGGLAGAQRATDVVRKADQFAQTSALGYIAHGAEGAQRSRLGAAIGAPWRAWKAVVEGGLAHVEHGTRNALLGKALRDSGIIGSYRQLIGMQDQAVKALIDGKLTPNMADHLAQSIDDMGGNWNRQTPAVRQAIGKVAPFGLWWLNSMRWLYRLPVTHPIKTAIAAGLYQATREQRNSKGQGFDAASPVPNFLQGTIDATLPGAGKVKIAPTYYSPGGTLGPEATTTAVDQFLPQLSSIVAAAKGENALSGQKLETANKKPLGAPEDILNVLGEALAGPVPLASQAQKVLTRGGKPYGTSNIITDVAAKLGGSSQVKPGTERPWSQVIAKLIAPTRFDFPKGGSAGGGAPSVPEASLTPAQQARVDRAIQRHESAGGSPAQAARIKRAEEAYDRRAAR